MQESEEARPEDDDLKNLAPEHQQLIRELRSKHRRVVFWVLDGFGVVALKNPKRFQFLQFQHEAKEATDKNDARETIYFNERVVTALVVYPAADRLKEIFDEYPSWSADASFEAMRLAQEGVTSVGKR